MARIINVSAGAAEYVVGIVTELTGKNISADVFEMALALGADAPRTGWVPADVSTQGATTAIRIVKLLITNVFPPGVYSAWVRVQDSPEVLPRLIASKITLK